MQVHFYLNEALLKSLYHTKTLFMILKARESCAQKQNFTGFRQEEKAREV